MHLVMAKVTSFGMSFSEKSYGEYHWEMGAEQILPELFVLQLRFNNEGDRPWTIPSRFVTDCNRGKFNLTASRRTTSY